MQKLFFVATTGICSLLFACTNSGESQAEKNRAVTHEIYKGIETGDTSKFGAIANDAIDHGDPSREMHSGDSIKRYLADLHNHARDLKMEILNDAASGDYVYTTVKMTYIALDKMMGKPGESINYKSVDVVRFQNGKVAEHWNYMDMNDVLKMVNSMSPSVTDTVSVSDSMTKK